MSADEVAGWPRPRFNPHPFRRRRPRTNPYRRGRPRFNPYRRRRPRKDPWRRPGMLDHPHGDEVALAAPRRPDDERA